MTTQPVARQRSVFVATFRGDDPPDATPTPLEGPRTITRVMQDLTRRLRDGEITGCYVSLEATPE